MHQIKDFFDIPYELWQEIVMTIILIPLVIWLFTELRSWFISSRPLNLLLKGFRGEAETLVFLAQLTGADNNYNKNLDQKYIASFPDPQPANTNNLSVKKFYNIDLIWTESDGRCATDVSNLFGKLGNVSRISIADVIKDWYTIGPTVSIGFNPKTEALIRDCHPISFRMTPKADNIVAIEIDGHAIKLDSVSPNDAGIIQKTFFKNTDTPVFILTGLGTMATEAAGHALNQHAVELGKLYGSKSFCVMFHSDINKGREYHDIRAVFPRPHWTRAIFYPSVYAMWYKKGVVPNKGYS